MKRIHLILFSSSLGIILADLIMSVFMYSTLPSVIPIHFGLSGAPDGWAPKSPLQVFMIPALSILIFLLFAILYRHPQYTSWPTTLILMTVDKDKREKIFEVLRTMDVWILLWVNLMFTYLQYTIIATSNGRAPGVVNFIMIGFLTVMFVFLIYINAKMYVTIRKILRSTRRSR